MKEFVSPNVGTDGVEDINVKMPMTDFALLMLGFRTLLAGVINRQNGERMLERNINIMMATMDPETVHKFYHFVGDISVALTEGHNVEELRTKHAELCDELGIDRDGDRLFPSTKNQPEPAPVVPPKKLGAQDNVQFMSINELLGEKPGKPPVS